MGDETISPFELFTYKRKSNQIIEDTSPEYDVSVLSHPVELVEIICEHQNGHENHYLNFYSNLGFAIEFNCPYTDETMNLIKYDFVNQKIYKGYDANAGDTVRPSEDIEWTEINIAFPWEDLKKIQGSIYKIEWVPLAWFKYYELEPNEYVESIEIVNTDDEFGLYENVILYQGEPTRVDDQRIDFSTSYQYKIEPSSLDFNESGFVTEEDTLKFNSDNLTWLLANNLYQSKVIFTLFNK